MILPVLCCGLPIQLIEEGSDGLASRRHGAARRLESRQPDCAQPVAATRLCGAPARGGRASFGSERADHTLQPTALVHEVFIRLVDQRQVDWQNRAHFFGVAANVMRRILVDHARRHGASKRGEGVRCVSIDEAKDVAASNEMPILALDHALDRLETVDAELAKIVELRAFGGLTIEEAAHVLSVSPSTAKRDWRTAKAWLNRELGSEVRP